MKLVQVPAQPWFIEDNTRYGIPRGTMMARQEDQSDPYRIKSKGESFYRIVGSAEDSTVYGLSAFDISLRDPYSRESVGPWFVNKVVNVDIDKLPKGRLFICSHTTVGCHTNLSICVDFDQVVESKMVGWKVKAMLITAIVDMIKGNAKLICSHHELMLSCKLEDLDNLDNELFGI